MISSWYPFAFVLLLNGIFALVLAALLNRRPTALGRNSLILMLISLAIWAICYAVIAISPDLEVKVFWLKLENIGILTTPVFWFFFTLQYAQLNKWLNNYTGALFFVIPVVSLVLLFNPNWFHYFYSGYAPYSETGGPLIIQRGPWYFAALIQAYLLNLGGMGVLIHRFIQFRHVFRKQALLLIGAVLFPLLVNVFYQLAPRIIPQYSVPADLTPFSFTLTAFFLSRGVFGLRIFDLLPIARHTVLEHIPEMVFVIDAEDRVVDANSAAQEALGIPMEQIIGKEVLEVFHGWPELLGRFLQAHETYQEEIQISSDPPLIFEVVVSALYNRFNQLEGRIIVAHDITDRKWLENDFKYANESLQSQLNEIEKLRAELQEQAIRDPLTNVYNRRYLSDSIERELAQADRNEKPASAVILDIDLFKQFNDTYGHRCGDYILQYVATFLNDRIRRGDVLCRYGGEEFVVFMPNAPLESAYQRAEQWCKEFADTLIDYEGKQLSTTFSAGVAAYPLHGTTGDALLNAADKAMYYAKNNGRSRVIMYEADMRTHDRFHK